MHTRTTGAKSKHQRLKLCFKEFDMLKILQLITAMDFLLLKSTDLLPQMLQHMDTKSMTTIVLLY